MSPEIMSEFNRMKEEIRALREVVDVAFIEMAKRRIVVPVMRAEKFIKKDTTGGTTGTLKVVSEAGSSSYSVADAYDGTITIQDGDGNNYKIGYYS